MRKLADKVNETAGEQITANVIFGIENKNASPHLHNADNIAKTLGVEIKDIWDIKSSKPLKFPTMLRKMWSGSEVQRWLDDKLTNHKE